MSPFAISKVIWTKGAYLHSTGLLEGMELTFLSRLSTQANAVLRPTTPCEIKLTRAMCSPTASSSRALVCLGCCSVLKYCDPLYTETSPAAVTQSLSLRMMSAHASLAPSYDVLISIIPLLRQEQAASWLLQLLQSDGKKHSFVIIQTISSMSGGRIFFPLSLQLYVCTRYLCQQRWCKIQHNCFHDKNAGY